MQNIWLGRVRGLHIEEKLTLMPLVHDHVNPIRRFSFLCCGCGSKILIINNMILRGDSMGLEVPDQTN
jgi:hypothetical protein